jgi:hypothetical protein
MWIPEFWNCFDNVMRSIHQTGSNTGVQVQNRYSRNPSHQNRSVAALFAASVRRGTSDHLGRAAAPNDEACPNSSAMRSSWLYLATRSDRAMEPVLIYATPRRPRDPR